MLYLCRFKPLRDHLRGFLIAAWAGDKIAEFSFPEISFHFPLRPWFFFVSPAYAGKSHLRQRPAQGPQDHPRVCGEKLKFIATLFSMWGSPPRMRGKESIAVGIGDGIGITLAYAGKSAEWFFKQLVKADHPRVCGEKARQCLRGT